VPGFIITKNGVSICAVDSDGLDLIDVRVSGDIWGPVLHTSIYPGAPSEMVGTYVISGRSYFTRWIRAIRLKSSLLPRF
jgi:hypothetical protein